MIDIARRLEALKGSWQGLELAPRSLAALGMPDKDSRYIEETIDQLAVMASRLAPAGQLAEVHRNCEDQLRQLEAFFIAGTRDIPNMRLLGFVALLLQMQSTLKQALGQTAAPHPLTSAGTTARPENRQPA